MFSLYRKLIINSQKLIKKWQISKIVSNINNKNVYKNQKI